MAPAFSSTRQAGAFALLLFVALLLPTVLGKKLLPPREQLYSSIPWGIGAFPYLHDQIFKETEDIDIAFMGSSPIWWGVDTPFVENQLSKQLQHKAVVRSLCWNWPGFDPFYFIAKDLLQHRKVKMIVFCDLSPGAPPTAHSQAAQWFRLRDDPNDLAGLNLRTKASYYSAAIIGIPRNLLLQARKNLPAIESEYISWPGFPHVTNPSSHDGSLSLRMIQNGAFESFSPQTNTFRSGATVYSESTKSDFHFANEKLPMTQGVFARKVAVLAREHGVKLVFLHMPRIAEIKSTHIDESFFWPKEFQSNVTMVGIPSAEIFRDIAATDVRKLFFDFQHFNENGQKFFTHLITPSLIDIYEKNQD